MQCIPPTARAAVRATGRANCTGADGLPGARKRGTGELSSPAIKPNAGLNWKQEVNQRLAAHKCRKESAAGNSNAAAPPHPSVNSRAAQAAARVAARYAHAPTYSQMLAEEARAAVRAAEAASQAVLKMHAAAESVLAELESAAAPEPVHPAVESRQSGATSSGTYFDSFLGIERPVAATEARTNGGELKIQWEPDLPLRPSHPAASMAHLPEQTALALGDWRGTIDYGEPETVEPAQLIPGNLIEFPRELIAARKARPRIAEGPLASEDDGRGQLSIFEVDPGSISIQPAPADAAAEVQSSGWSKLMLDTEAIPSPAADAATDSPTHAIDSAPLHLRAMAAMVDVGLIGAIFVAASFVAANNVISPPAMRTMELAAAGAFVAIWLLYQSLFLMFAGITPGMRYAGIALCNFDDRRPSRKQLRRRIWAVLLSLLPVGLGMLWSIFDEDHLSWHDRISRTYARCG